MEIGQFIISFISQNPENKPFETALNELPYMQETTPRRLRATGGLARPTCY
jgi:hypothetical protein